MSDTIKLSVWHNLTAFDHNWTQKKLTNLNQWGGC